MANEEMRKVCFSSEDYYEFIALEDIIKKLGDVSVVEVHDNTVCIEIDELDAFANHMAVHKRAMDIIIAKIKKTQ
jgi:hypothetical protein